MGEFIMNIYERVYELKLISSERLRELMKRDIPILCEKRNCYCNIEVKSKWYWFYDKYTITVTGETEDLAYIENQLKYLSQIR